MKLNDVYTKPLSSVVEQMEMVKLDVHSDSGGNVQCIELKYIVPKNRSEEIAKLGRFTDDCC